MGGLLAIVLGFALQWVGYEPNVPQSAATQQVILALYGFLPAGCFAVGLFLLLRFQLNEAEYAEIRRQLDARSAGSPPPTVQSP